MAGSGAGSSASANTSGPPNRETTAPIIVAATATPSSLGTGPTVGANPVR